MKRNRLLIATIIYWFLLVYIAAGLVWWFIALQQQNHLVAGLRAQGLDPNSPAFTATMTNITKQERLKTAQYVGEGATFLLLFLLGAVFVYVPVRRQIKWQQQQQNFMMAVTHELKTPIAVAKLNLETLLKYQLEDANKHKIIRSSLEEIGRLDVLANNILISAQLEAGHSRIFREQLDFSELADALASDFKRQFPERKWLTRIQPGVHLKGDPTLLQMLIRNLVENALKYSPPSGLIALELFCDLGRVTLRVSDEGSGIPASERKNIFEKFYRIGNEQTRTTQGTGLGLYLSRLVVLEHHGRIEVADNSPAGSIFKVELPT